MMQGLLHATTVQRGACALGTGQAAMAVGKQKLRIVVGLPEPAQDIQSGVWQRDKAVAIAFGVANMHPVAHRIDVAHLQGQSFREAQAQAVQREIEHPVAQGVGGRKHCLRLFDGDDIGQT